MTTLPESTRDAMLAALVGPLDGGYVEVRDGDAPAPNAAATGNLLATIPLNDPAFAIAAGVATGEVTPQPEALGAETGSIGWCRAYTPDDSPVINVEPQEMELSAPVVNEGSPIRILSWVIEMPDGS